LRATRRIGITMRHGNVLVLGGSGFIGRYVVNFLIERGCRVLVPARPCQAPDRVPDLRGGRGQHP
jgi:uncharacterized protein YbjT (DUF2867 family)